MRSLLAERTYKWSFKSCTNAVAVVALSKHLFLENHAQNSQQASKIKGLRSDRAVYRPHAEFMINIS